MAKATPTIINALSKDCKGKSFSTTENQIKSIKYRKNTTVQMTPKHIKIIPSASIHLHLPLELFPLISLMTK